MRINDITQKLGVEVVADAITLRELEGSEWFITGVAECSFGVTNEKTVELLGCSRELGRLKLTIEALNVEQIDNLNQVLKTFNKGEI